jgi:hypothetical protein
MMTDPLGNIDGAAIAFPDRNLSAGVRVLDVASGTFSDLDVRSTYPLVDAGNWRRLKVYCLDDGYFYVYASLDTEVVGAGRWRVSLWRALADGSGVAQLAEYQHSSRLDVLRIDATHLAVGKSLVAGGFDTQIVEVTTGNDQGSEVPVDDPAVVGVWDVGTSVSVGAVVFGGSAFAHRVEDTGSEYAPIALQNPDDVGGAWVNGLQFTCSSDRESVLAVASAGSSLSTNWFDADTERPLTLSGGPTIQETTDSDLPDAVYMLDVNP